MICCTSFLQSSDYAASVLGQRSEYFSYGSLCHYSMEVLTFGTGSKSSYKDTAIHFCHHSSIEPDFHVFPPDPTSQSQTMMCRKLP
jgi:hypothetical protein